MHRFLPLFRSDSIAVPIPTLSSIDWMASANSMGHVAPSVASRPLQRALLNFVKPPFLALKRILGRI
jgi:hypothetical protein